MTSQVVFAEPVRKAIGTFGGSLKDVPAKALGSAALRRTSITAVTLLLLRVASASAGQLPQYEVAGLPISPHQISVLGSGGIQEQSRTPTLMLNGMPASPHQIAVLQPRTKRQIADELHKDRASD
jgi:hypothetical protein